MTTISIDQDIWEKFQELVRYEKELGRPYSYVQLEDGTREPDPGANPLNQLTRNLICMVYHSDSISQVWDPGHRIWDLFRELVLLAGSPEVTR